MGINRFLNFDIPRLISAVRHWRSTSIVSSRGLRFKLVSDNWITKYRARSFNDKEPEMLDWLDKNLQDGDVFFDVGANVGIYSIYAALRNKRSIIYAFEPEYANLYQLKMNIINNELSNKIMPYSIALDDRMGISHLYTQDMTPGSALHTVSSRDLQRTHTGHKVIWKEGIATMTMDRFCDFSGIKPSLVKIDVDGNELAILRGGQRTFMDPNLRTIYIELDSSQAGCEEKLTNYGFVQVEKTRDNQIWKKL